MVSVCVGRALQYWIDYEIVGLHLHCIQPLSLSKLSQLAGYHNSSKNPAQRVIDPVCSR